MLNNLEDLALEAIPTEVEVNTSWDPKLKSQASFHNGLLSKLNMGSKVKVYINPVEVKSTSDEGEEIVTHMAYPITCKNPVSYGALITSAERSEYDESVKGEISAINRKARTNPEDPEIAVHDQFIQYVKDGLNAIGYHS